MSLHQRSIPRRIWYDHNDYGVLSPWLMGMVLFYHVQTVLRHRLRRRVQANVVWLEFTRLEHSLSGDRSNIGIFVSSSACVPTRVGMTSRVKN